MKVIVVTNTTARNQHVNKQYLHSILSLINTFQNATIKCENDIVG